MKNKILIKDILYGVLVGDALGVPYEFKSRNEIHAHPAKEMIGFGTHNQPKGTFSDDGSLTLCLADAIVKSGYSIQSIANNIVQWYDNNLWTAHGVVFDIGVATEEAVYNLREGVNPILAGGNDEYSNGNGSLMRILPLLMITKDINNIEERFKLVKEVSSITHSHIRSIISCFYYLEFALLLLSSKDLGNIYLEVQNNVSSFLESNKINLEERKKFNRLLDNKIYEFDESEIQSSGYVIHTLEASIWCLFNTSNYASSVLKAVNLGDDTDTTSAVTGGLSSIYYGSENIPKDWINSIARKKDIDDLIESYK
ncbi:ADP-ribosylglycohydrolase family protein [Elizabethkingia argentiflava]|uniref:ADP-ribosylglycohydrolase family protein n=1 Tax=Elizabethkingia argenteiflava TaxID=2681556 RepID=A0A845PVS3_9FLAO|nr:ADP-ribosylglycohydrolase family protein [Elizabethkingia argenteiflava]NAW50966.1 ADP-ribosylglycohydrolase family protein [Elizabethkingia argenteiflava]